MVRAVVRLDFKLQLRKMENNVIETWQSGPKLLESNVV